MSRRTIYLVLLTAVAVAGGLIAATRGRGAEHGARAALAAGNWAGAEAQARQWKAERPGDASAADRLRSRALFALKRDAEAMRLFAEIDPAALEVIDMLDASRSLDRRGFHALAWSLVEAAARIDPRDPIARAERARFDSRIGELGSATRTTEHLGTVPDGRAMAQVVIGLATLATVPDEAKDPVVDRLLLKGRDTLRSVKSPTAARNQIARLLIELDRPAEARAWLPQKLEPGVDAESAWLIGRAALREGKFDVAEESLAFAGEWSKRHPAAFEPAPFAGAASCKECHWNLTQTQQTSRHATTIHHGPALARLPLPAGPVADPGDPGVVHTFRTRPDGVVAETEAGGAVSRLLMDYALGSGNHGLTMVGTDASGRRRESRISYYTGGQAWGLTEGFEPHPRDRDRMRGEPLSEAGFRDCLHCHMTRYRGLAGSAGQEAADHGIGCERCHGPGANHVAASRAGFPESAIAHSKRATAAQRSAICAECHSADGTIPPSDPQYVRFQSTTFPASRCATVAKESFDCTTCHDPHRNVATSPAFYESKCLTCHDAGRGGSAVSTCRVDPKAGCIGCHMPKVENVLPFTAFTDHHIRVHRPTPPVTAGPSSADRASR